MPNGSFKDEFASFFEGPNRVTLRDVLKKTTGEFQNLDFKSEWPDAPKLARHLLAMGNSEGGCMIIGVSEQPDGSFDPVGLSTFADKTDIINKIKNFVPNQILHKIDIKDFPYTESEYLKIKGKKFQVIFFRVDPEDLPLVSTQGEKEKIRENTIYVRRGPSSEIANYEELQIIINKRISTGYSSQREINLRTHLEQLRALMDELPRCNLKTYFPNVFGAADEANHKSFIEGLIKTKRKQIEDLVNTI